ncbi:hypothetical protein HYV21_02255 [Candidatus Microgenomates bacterium]|nr:hypothetical protein [Candidatus Microgenomates bacterium]
MGNEFLSIRHGKMRGLVGIPLTPGRVEQLHQMIQLLIDYASEIIHVLAESETQDAFTPLAKETQRIMEARDAEFWLVGEGELSSFSKAAIIFPADKKDGAYATIVLNQDRLLPFDKGRIPQKAIEELILAIVDLPGARKFLELRGIRALTPAEFIERVKGNPENQRVVPVRDLMA